MVKLSKLSKFIVCKNVKESFSYLKSLWSWKLISSRYNEFRKFVVQFFPAILLKKWIFVVWTLIINSIQWKMVRKKSRTSFKMSLQRRNFNLQNYTRFSSRRQFFNISTHVWIFTILRKEVASHFHDAKSSSKRMEKREKEKFTNSIKASCLKTRSSRYDLSFKLHSTRSFLFHYK